MWLQLLKAQIRRWHRGCRWPSQVVRWCALMASCVGWSVLSVSAAGAAPTGVVVMSSTMQPIVEEVSVAGTVTAPRVARLSTDVAGRVDGMRVDVADRVAAGDVLIHLDSGLTQLELDAAAADIAQAREALSDARRRAKDAKRLRAQGIAASTHEALMSEVRVDAAQVQALEARRQHIQERLRRHELRAPFPGVVSRKLTELGEWIAPGDEVLELVDDAALRVELQVPQAYFGRVGQDAAVQLQLAAMPEAPVGGRVGAIVPVSDPTARSFLVRVHPVDEGLPLTPGMSATARFSLATGREGVVVPRDALLRHPDGRVTVWVVGEAGGTHRVEERVVRPGIGFDGQVEIREGLAAGEQVVVEGNEALQQDQAVTVRGAR